MSKRTNRKIQTPISTVESNDVWVIGYDEEGNRVFVVKGPDE